MMRFFGSLCIGLGLCHAVSAAAAEAVNLAPNPGFETADGRQPAFWTQRTPSDAERALSWAAGSGRSGGRCLEIRNLANTLSRWRTGHLHDFSLRPGSKCRLTGWIKTKDAKGDAHFQLYFITADGQIAAQPHSQSVTGTREWAQVALACDVPEKTGYVMIYAGLRGNGSAWFDDLVMDGVPARPEGKVGLPSLAIAARDFDCREGFQPASWRRTTVLRLSLGAKRGRAEAVFWGSSARYDVSVTCGGQRDGCASWRLLVNDRKIASWTPQEMKDVPKAEDGLREKLITGVDVQRLSRIVVEGEAKSGNCCVVGRIVFTPVGRFAGEFLAEDKLRVRPTLRVHEPIDQRRGARRMLSSFINRGATQVVDQRERELASLKTPEQWKARQQRTRGRLVEFLGDFGPKCPLEPRIVGKLDRPDYVIEKLIFQSQPGYFCTANFYLPKRREFPRPGVIFTCGHAAEGKAYHLYHETCLGLVLKGYVVLGLDPTGQGERSEYFDPTTGKPLVPLTVSQHHYLARPSWLVGRSLAGYRTWDCIRAVDYLVGRPEVDAEKIAAVGNSGGGQMALLITAADPRVKVCAAAHPGGSMENTYLSGQGIIDKEILSLIPPRPCAMVVGRDSGEEPGHRRKLDDMLRFYEGLGVEKDRGRMLIVEGVHDMKKPKREASYGWLNKWLGQQAEGAEEPPLKPETVEALNCTKTGFTLRDLGSESGQTLNARLAERLRPPRPLPGDRKSLDAQRTALKGAVAKRIGLTLPEKRAVPPCTKQGEFQADRYAAEKLLIESEPGILLPSLLLVPKQTDNTLPIVLYAGELGKPTSAAGHSLARISHHTGTVRDRVPLLRKKQCRRNTPALLVSRQAVAHHGEKCGLVLELVRKGHTVLAVDVRGSGETDPRDQATLTPLIRYQPQQFRFDSLAVNAAYSGTTMLAMRTFDVIRAIDYLESRADLTGRRLLLVGKGLGGLWMLTAAAFDSRPAAVACVKTVPSYKLIVGSRYYNTRDYFWVNGALADFDVPDLIGLVAPRPVALIDPADALLEPLDRDRCLDICKWPRAVYESFEVGGRLHVIKTAGGTAEEASRAMHTTGRNGMMFDGD